MEKKLRKHAQAIFQSALRAADPVQAVSRFLHRDGDTLFAGRRRYPLSRFEHIWVIGAGKASAAMALPVERCLGTRITGGLINVKYGHGVRLRRIGIQEAGHPAPDQAGIEGTQRIAAIARQAGERDLVICLISGGASALTPYPAPPITLAEKRETTKLLLECGANIHEINAVRKHISAFKGGQLARLAAPATLVSLMLSDVIGDSLDAIGSGPTVADTSTFADAHSILKRYGLLQRVPASVLERLRGKREETPKPGDPVFARTHNLIVGSNRLAVDAAARKARELGYKPLVLSTFLEGETRDVARVHVAIAKEIRASGRPVRAPACLISGGETTVTIQGTGLGGRNQEFVLAAAIDGAGMPGMVVLSGGTDGTDGPTDAAGAIAGGDSFDRAFRLGLDARSYLSRNDSYHFFEPLGDLLKTGPTRTNVMDVRLLLLA